MSHKTAQLVVVGSINMDLVVRVASLPRPGETVVGRELRQIPGGKGANQAVAAARLGASTTLIGRVGDDGFGSQLVDALRDCGVGVEQVVAIPNCSSGVAFIGVEDSGQNAITIVSGANGRLSPADVQPCQPAISAADVVLLQWEIPLETVLATIQMARRSGVLAVLDPAPVPAASVPEALLEVDLISPNQSESEQLTRIAVTDPPSAQRAARQLVERGAGRVVIKLGEQGAFWYESEARCGHVPAARVSVVDTTAAGDAFTAGLALALAEGRNLPDAVRFGCAAGTLATTKLGAQQSMPTRDAVERFLTAAR